jgi:xanthine dehydrogenase accessory factor
MMRDVVRELSGALDKARPVAYCRLVETRGSTPQKAGALMLVYADGSQAGTLGGGCVEAEVKRRALAVLANGQAEVARFQLDSDYGWDDGLICGGRMQVLIEPLGAGGEDKYFDEMKRLVEAGAGFTEAIAYDADASGMEVPRSYLFDEEGRSVAALRSLSDVPPPVQADLRELRTRPRPYTASGVAYLPLFPRCRLVIVGGGHVGQAVAVLAGDLDFDVWVVDDRQDILSEERFPTAAQRIVGPVDQVLPNLEITADTFCLIVTRGHNHDEEALYHLADRGARYVGLIGSRRKIRMIFEDLRDNGIPGDALERVHAPVGIDIGSQSVPEIAVSICAELVAFRNCEGIVPGRPQAVAVTSEP